VRIVSLLPAATEIVCALGLRDRLAGRSHCCDFPEDVASLPALTRARVDVSLPGGRIDEQVRDLFARGLPLYELDEGALEALAPDVVVTQEACEVCAISYDQVVSSLRGAARSARVVSLAPSRLEDVVGDVRRVAGACGVGPRGEELAGVLRQRLDAVASLAGGGGSRPRVAVVEWLDPPMLAGHWVPDAIAAAGGVPLGPEPGAPSPYASWDEIAALGADAVIVAPCGFDLERTVRESAHVADRLRSLAPRVLLLDGDAYLNRPGPRLVDAVETVAAWLRGGQAPRDRAEPLLVDRPGLSLPT
jgi:iron complex transport system substrate-binding protein